MTRREFALSAGGLASALLPAGELRAQTAIDQNPIRRRGQVSSAMFVSRGLVGPKLHRNSSVATGKQVNIPVLYGF